MINSATHSLAPQPVIRAEKISKVFRDFWLRAKVRAVRDFSCEIMPGEVFGLLGPNGSGKTTIIKMTLGLLKPSGGSMKVLGHAPDHVNTKARIGYLPEESYLYPFLTAEETLLFYGSLFDLNGTERKQRADELLDMVGLAHARNRRIGEFSKGMARRIGLAQALINDPDLVILDEPTSGLDPIGCRQMKDLILALARRGKSVLLSSHLLADVEDVCDRVSILYNGNVLIEGAIKQLLEQQEAVRLTFRSMAPQEIDRLLGIVRRDAGVSPTVDHPMMTLEQFFLDTIARAQSDSDGLPAGASSGSGLADYLLKGKTRSENNHE
jgi:ABC-2 type transport system ATP-binding protein